MKIKPFALHVLLNVSLAANYALAQGTFTYDQQSANEGTGGGIANSIQLNQPLGQSFTPSLAGVDFIRLNVGDSAVNGLGATMYVNLRTDSINGPIVATTDLLTMPDGFSGFPNFFFSSRVTLTLGATYYFQPVVQSGDFWAIVGYNSYNYAGGVAYYQGTAAPGFDLWFREGIYTVPEPSVLTLIGFTISCFILRRRKAGL